MKTKLLLAVALLVLLFTWFVGRIAVGSSRANRARAEEQKARFRAQEIAEMLAVQGEPRKIPPARATVSATVTVRGRLLDQDGKPLGQRALGFVKEGLRLGDSGFSFMSDGLTGDDGSFRFELPVGQSWQALLPQEALSMARAARR